MAAIAEGAGVVKRSLQEFLEIHRWDQKWMRDRVQQIVATEHADEQAIGVIDETSYAKRGVSTAGVQRQYCGASGKIDNCVVTVHLGYVVKDFHTLLDAELFLPEERWAGDRQRCREAGIPEDLEYRPKWQIGLELLERALSNGVHLRWLVADEEYGCCGQFRQTVADQGIWYVVEVPCSTLGWTRKPRLEQEFRRSGSSPKIALAPGASASRRVDQLWQRGGPSWEYFHVKNTEGGPVVWEVRATRFLASEESLPGTEQWLLIGRHALSGEHKYFLSNAPAETSRETLLHVGFSRAHIEQIFEEAKGQVGLDEFEVRHYQPLMRHLILSMVSMLFLILQRQRMEGEKKVVVEPAPDPSSDGAAARRGSEPGGAPAETEATVGSLRLRAPSTPAGKEEPSQEPLAQTSPTRHPALATAEML